MRTLLRGRYLWALAIIAVIYFVCDLALFPDKLQHGDGQTELNTTSNSDDSKNISIDWCQPLHYRADADKWPTVALVSCPGSGNTWLRYLLMQATGIYAGSVCKDKELQEAGFSAELVSNSSVCVVKTHQWGPQQRKLFDRAVLLVRSPYDAILADFHLQKSGRTHTGHATLEEFTKENGEVWKKHVAGQLYFWYHLYQDWLDEFDGPMHVVFYEDLVTDLEPTLRSLLDFLETPVSDDAIQCALERKEGLFHRKSAQLPIDLFSDQQKQNIEKDKTKIYDKIREMQNNQAK